MHTTLRIINRSGGDTNSDIVVIQKNPTSASEERTIAWTVISNLGPGASHSFGFSDEFAIRTIDSKGNQSPLQSAGYGEVWRLRKAGDDDELESAGKGPLDQLQVENQLEQGAIVVRLYRDGRLLDVKTDVAPAQSAVFSFAPTIFIGLLHGLQQGQELSAEQTAGISRGFDLGNVVSADIILSGGGTETDPHVFQMTNIILSS